MITPNTAAVLITAIARDLHVFGVSTNGTDLATLHALSRRARWVADVAAAEAHRRQACAAFEEQTRIAREGSVPERLAAAAAAARHAEARSGAELHLSRLMDDRPA